jgi:DNA repair exonuclease SbcCD ATPase subunit
MAVTAMKTKSSIDSVREIVQDFLVPELKAVKVSIESLQIEMRLRDEKQTQAIMHLDDKLTQSTKNLGDKLTQSTRNLDDKLTQSTQYLSENIRQISDKIDSSAELRERLASLEARLPRN